MYLSNFFFMLFQQLESSGSSGERQNSINQSIDAGEPNNVTTINLQSTIGPSLQVPRRNSLGRSPSIGESTSCSVSAASACPTTSSATSHSGPSNLGCGQPGGPDHGEVASKSPLSVVTNAEDLTRATTPTKRNRFLKRQDCLEKGGDGELDLSITPTPMGPGKSSPCSPMMLSPYPSLGSPPPAHDNPPVTMHDGQVTSNATMLTKQRSTSSISNPSDIFNSSLSETPIPDPFHTNSVDNLSVPTSCGGAGPPPPAPSLPPPPIAHKLPAVRVIPDAMDQLSLDISGSGSVSGGGGGGCGLDSVVPTSMSTSSAGVTLATPPNNNLNYGLLHANFRSTRPPSSLGGGVGGGHAAEQHPHFNMEAACSVHHRVTPPTSSQTTMSSLPSSRTTSRSQTSPMHHQHNMMTTAGGGGGHGGHGNHMVGPPPVHHDFGTSTSSMAPTTSSPSSSALYSSTTTAQGHHQVVPTEQFGHCPKERDGPALGCNYCWNTTDVNGRILRRKTKYHCPDCQANLCIVPCFQAYHEALDKEKPEQKC